MSVWAADWNLCTMVSAYWDIPGLLLVSIYHQQPVWDGLTVTLPKVCLLWGSYHNSQVIQIVLRRICNWPSASICRSLMSRSWCELSWDFNILCLCFLSCNFRDGRHSPLFLLFNLTNAQGNHVCGASKKGEYSKLGVTKDKTFHRSFVILGVN